MSFCHKLLADTGVATAPGVDFDTVAGNNFVRLSFAGSTEQIVAGLTRLESWLG
jgi:aspartate/methionine/tyrosine aminotransferase